MPGTCLRTQDDGRRTAPDLPVRGRHLCVVAYSPAALRSASTRSVRSHVKSASSRPK